VDLNQNNIKKMDYFLRDLISTLKSQVDYQVIGGWDILSEAEKEDYLKKVQRNVGNLYESLNKNIVEKSRKMQELANVAMQAKEELEIERNELQKRNNVIEQDLIFARNIQRQIIPKISGNPAIGLFYKPMDQLGGDFFDIIEDKDTGKTGFFICDVSGHGIPASLVTTIVKSMLFQLKDVIGIPSYVLSYMNQILFELIPGNFVTGFLGEVDPVKNNLLYSSAGHNFPILVNARGVSYIKPEKQGIPLAVLSNNELTKTGRSYSDENCHLDHGSKLFIYTDGLTEAIPAGADIAGHVPDFETAMLEKVLIKYRALPAQVFLENIYLELLGFRGTDKFEDDICMICFDHN
jgi:phosphoserine phosphatase RsbU/P